MTRKKVAIIIGVLLIGAAEPQLADELAGALPPDQIHRCGTLAVAAETARELALSGDVVLLSPACSSFDQFQNYEHRGDVFRQAVKSLQTPSGPTIRSPEKITTEDISKQMLF